jgi:hypothetical protein
MHMQEPPGIFSSKIRKSEPFLNYRFYVYTDTDTGATRYRSKIRKSEPLDVEQRPPCFWHFSIIS